MDDILDYISEEQTLGKAIGKDLSEGKLTLPLIHTLRSCPPDDKKRIIEIIKNHNRREDDLGYVMGLVHRCAGVDYTVKRAASYIEQATNSLSSFSPCREKEALLTIAEYTIKRKQ
jgi:octaprenyl-diphosphate synthase